jgi:FAD/FMN-containing dehydrogenase
LPLPSISDQLRERLGTEAVLSAPAEIAPYLTDYRGLCQGRAPAVVLPRTVAEVSQLLAFCNERRIGVVPQGGNTGYCAGATPDESGQQIVVALARLNRIRSLDAAGYTVIAEAGCVLQALQRAAEHADRFFPLSLGSQGTCQLGGNLSTNAGGVHVLRYGMMRDLVLGLEVVLADGRVLSSLSPLRKDNTGYDVKALFLGAEGTLGVITAASLKLYPKVRNVSAAFVAVPDVASAVELLGAFRERCGELVSSFELIPRSGLDLALRHIAGLSDPFREHHPWYVLCELSSSRAEEPLEELTQDVLAAALEDGRALDAVLAQSERQRSEFWRLREHIPEAQRLEGASLKHDVSVPVGRLAQFVERGAAWVQSHVPEGRLVAYGHVGDGNLHFNVSQVPGSDAQVFRARAGAVMRALHDLVQEFGGSFSAEHGIGRLKVAELERYGSAVELDLMRAIKNAFDPNGILNPGKVLRTQPLRAEESS